MSNVAVRIAHAHRVVVFPVLRYPVPLSCKHYRPTSVLFYDHPRPYDVWLDGIQCYLHGMEYPCQNRNTCTYQWHYNQLHSAASFAVSLLMEVHWVQLIALTHTASLQFQWLLPHLKHVHTSRHLCLRPCWSLTS